MHELDQDFEPGVKCHALVALCKLFYADLRNCAGITAQPAATRVLNAIVSACGMVVGSPAQAESDGLPLVTVENLRVHLCKQDPCGSRCSRISNREAINAQQLARVTDLHRRAWTENGGQHQCMCRRREKTRMQACNSAPLNQQQCASVELLTNEHQPGCKHSAAVSCKRWQVAHSGRTAEDV